MRYGHKPTNDKQKRRTTLTQVTKWLEVWFCRYCRWAQTTANK